MRKSLQFSSKLSRQIVGQLRKFRSQHGRKTTRWTTAAYPKIQCARPNCHPLCINRKVQPGICPKCVCPAPLYPPMLHPQTPFAKTPVFFPNFPPPPPPPPLPPKQLLRSIKTPNVPFPPLPLLPPGMTYPPFLSF
ncbi:hypothetical protein NPIL_195161 [Nephila pilipes]|uniref:Uncharacterized protein n=1 Tax=Nephila pilipes TaxID=299642 RepID=A0A8X6NME6_NEPPI|nr:hypothetical protein NPIL_195161 [Nephila pilipes]